MAVPPSQDPSAWAAKPWASSFGSAGPGGVSFQVAASEFFPIDVSCRCVEENEIRVYLYEGELAICKATFCLSS